MIFVVMRDDGNVFKRGVEFAEGGFRSAGRLSPYNRVVDYLPYIIAVECGIGFMPGTEVEDLSHASVEAATAPEYLSAREPAYKYQLIGIGNLKPLAVCFLLGQLNIFGKVSRDGVAGLYDPDSLLFVIFPPFGAAYGTHKFYEGLCEVPRVKNNKAHSIQNSLFYPLGNLFAYHVMRYMAPPD